MGNSDEQRRLGAGRPRMAPHKLRRGIAPFPEKAFDCHSPAPAGQRMRFFVTGTDTNVGKTHVARLIVEGMRRQGIDCVGLKPICCGGREDAEALHAAAGGALTLNEINPIWLRTPAAPYTASIVENRSIDLEMLRENFGRVGSKHESFVVEGAGGWLVPIAREYSMADFAAELGLPILVVVSNRLGALNHTLLTIESIRARRLPLAGLILNQCAPEEDVATVTNRGVLEDLSDVPILAEVRYQDTQITPFWEALAPHTSPNA